MGTKEVSKRKSGPDSIPAGPNVSASPARENLPEQRVSLEPRTAPNALTSPNTPPFLTFRERAAAQYGSDMDQLRAQFDTADPSQKAKIEAQIAARQDAEDGMNFGS